MAKKEASESSESDVWNIAKAFTTLKILLPLKELDTLVITAIYGTERIDESLMIPAQVKIFNRIESIQRLIDTLKLIFENSYFVLKKDDKKKVDTFLKEIGEVEGVLDGISKVREDQRTHVKETIINEKHFNLCLTKLRKIKQELLAPLNQANLIFASSEEIDLEKLKNELIEGG